MVTTPRPSTCHLDVRLLRGPIAGEQASCWTSGHSFEEKNGLAAISLHISSNIVRDPAEIASKRFRYGAESDATNGVEESSPMLT